MLSGCKKIKSQLKHQFTAEESNYIKINAFNQ